MIFVIHSLQILFDELCIDLSGGNIAVTQHFLNRPEIRSVLEQMRRKAVPQRVRRDLLVDVRFFLIVFDDLPESLTAHALAGDVYEQ